MDKPAYVFLLEEIAVLVIVLPEIRVLCRSTIALGEARDCSALM
jgi:hypothetical protein